MPHVADGVRSSSSSTNKIAPVEVDPPSIETANSAARAGEGPSINQGQLAPLADKLNSLSSLEEIGTAGSLRSEDVAVGDSKAGQIQATSNKAASRGMGYQRLLSLTLARNVFQCVAWKGFRSAWITGKSHRYSVQLLRSPTVLRACVQRKRSDRSAQRNSRLLYT